MKKNYEIKKNYKSLNLKNKVYHSKSSKVQLSRSENVNYLSKTFDMERNHFQYSSVKNPYLILLKLFDVQVVDERYLHD